MSLNIAEFLELKTLIICFCLFSLLEFFFPARKWSFSVNYFLNWVSFGILSLSIQFSRAFWGFIFSSLAFLLPYEGLGHNLPFSARFVCVLVIVDFCFYVVHRCMHEIPGLWRIHSWHHSPHKLTAMAGFRASFLHVLFFGAAQVLIPTFLFKFSLEELGYYYMVAVIVQFLNHVNIDFNTLKVPQFIHKIFVTSYVHRIHHANNRMWQDSNYGAILTIWDRLLGTYSNVPQPEVADHMELGSTSDGRPFWRQIIGW